MAPHCITFPLASILLLKSNHLPQPPTCRVFQNWAQVKHLDMPCPKGAWCPSPTHSLNFHNILCMPIPSHCFKMTDFLTALPRDWILFFFFNIMAFSGCFFKNLFTLFIFYFWLHWVFIFGCARAFLWLRWAGATPRCGARAYHCGGLPCCRAQAPGMRAQQLWPTGSAVVARGLQSAGPVVVAHGSSCSAACGILPDQGSNPCPLHWQADSQPLRHQGSPRLDPLRLVISHL